MGLSPSPDRCLPVVVVFGGAFFLAIGSRTGWRADRESMHLSGVPGAPSPDGRRGMLSRGLAAEGASMRWTVTRVAEIELAARGGSLASHRDE